MSLRRIMTLLLAALLMCAPVLAAALEPLPMNNLSAGPVPKDENYISDTEYVDESISVKIYEGRYADTDYVYAHVKISHPSQLRTAPAASANGGNASFHSSSTYKARIVAKAVNAVIAMNGDYHSKAEGKVALRMSTQIRNNADGIRDVLIVDMNGDFSYLTNPSKQEYTEYYEANKEDMYQVFCFGPVLVENGVSVIAPDYQNGYVGAQNLAQRAALCQLGPLEYMIVTSYGNQTKGNKGMTIPEFATVCEMAGKELCETGCQLAFNLDGGNSTAMIFKQLDKKTNMKLYTKVNCPEIERFLSDIIYFATLVK